MQRIDERHGIGTVHPVLGAILMGEQRAHHRAAARAAWLSIGREDLDLSE